MTFPAYVRYEQKLYPGSSHCWAIARCRKLPAEARILDIGPGSGIMANELGKLGLRHICAVEIEAATREHLKDKYERIVEDINTFKGQTFDCVLLLDVLEHMADPLNFLKVVKDYLSPGGVILISVPNVAHLSVRACLFFGFFEYTQRGLLDSTHLRFFTRRTFRRMLDEAGLQAVERNSTIPPLELLLPGWVSRSLIFRLGARLHLLLARCLPRLLAYQHLAECICPQGRSSKSEDPLNANRK